MRITKSISCREKLLVKKCHICGGLSESVQEPRKCGDCKKSFLPQNYFGKVHAKNDKEFDQLFSHTDQMHEEDLVKGLNVLW